MYLFVIWEMPLLFGSFSLTRANDQLLPSSSLLFMVENKPFFRETGTWPWPRKWVVYYTYYWVESCLRRSFDKTSPFTTRSTSIVLWSGVVSRKKYHILHPGIPGELSNQWAIKRLLRTNMINHLQLLKENHKSHLCCCELLWKTYRPAPASSFIVYTRNFWMEEFKMGLKNLMFRQKAIH